VWSEEERMKYNNQHMKNKILDASIFWSFDQSGYLRHERDFKETYSFKKGSRALITGGTSGIGEASALELIRHGVDVTITGRDAKKAEKLLKNQTDLHFNKIDMSEWSGFDALVDQVKELDYLVLNAGSMPEHFQTNSEGVELQFASQLFGHYILSHKLVNAGKLKKGARIVWVTSGGMYLKPLHTDTIFKNENYDKVENYANVKRAQVTVLPFFKQEFPDQIVTAMHPGWAATPGVAESIPGFSKFMDGRLRTPLQAADTILWLLSTKEEITSGELYFDRKKVSPHFFWFTKKSSQHIHELQSLLKKYL
jgi:NAD(P)-dependent dehydrogenase (short-subunit alcohol dehydrogenase family)